MIIRAAAPFFYILHFIFLHVYVEIIVQIARQGIQSKLLFFSNKAFNCLKNTHSTSTQTFKSERKFVHTILQTTSCNSLSFSTSCKIWRYYSSECRFDKAIIKSSCMVPFYESVFYLSNNPNKWDIYHIKTSGSNNLEKSSFAFLNWCNLCEEKIRCID